MRHATDRDDKEKRITIERSAKCHKCGCSYEEALWRNKIDGKSVLSRRWRSATDYGYIYIEESIYTLTIIPVIDFLVRHFGWYLKLNAVNGRYLKLNAGI